MLKTYNTRPGIIFSLFIALLAHIPRLIRQGLGEFTISTVLLFLSILACWFIHHFFLLNGLPKAFKGNSKLRGLTSIGSGLVFVFLINSISGNNLETHWLYWGSPSSLTTGQMMLINLFRSSVISGFCYFVVYYIRVNIQLQNSKLENEYLKQDQLKAQLFSLQQQLSPHFLFNSLSTLKTIAPDNATKTYVMQLANVYRYLLTFHDHQQITVREELAFTQSYLYILQERFEEALQVSIQIGDNFLDYYMPPLTLQILVENAFKHNIVSADQPLHLRIYTNGSTIPANDSGIPVNDSGMVANDAARLTVENSYQPKLSVEGSNGKGLQNINDRYQLLAGRQITICQSESLFIVTLPLLEP